jgi:UDP-glucose/GDP-mannose dehydrogenase family, NAD binding domain
VPGFADQEVQTLARRSNRRFGWAENAKISPAHAMAGAQAASGRPELRRVRPIRSFTQHRIRVRDAATDAIPVRYPRFMTRDRLKTAVVGAGYVGIATAVGLAEQGRDIVLVEQDPARLAALADGRIPFHEPGLPEAYAT